MSRPSRFAKLNACGNTTSIFSQAVQAAHYVGVTNNLIRRVYEHKNKLADGHTKQYQIDRLAYYEAYDTAYQAIQREKNIKHWPRAWKTRLISKENDTWRDLYDEVAQP